MTRFQMKLGGWDFAGVTRKDGGGGVGSVAMRREDGRAETFCLSLYAEASGYTDGNWLFDVPEETHRSIGEMAG